MMPKRPKPIEEGFRVEADEQGQPRMQFDNRRVFMAALKGWIGQRGILRLEPEIQIRSLRAHRYLFGHVYKVGVEALREAGYSTLTTEQLHELMKERHNPVTIVDPFTGEERTVGGSTKKLTVEAFGVFIERVMVDLAELAGCTFDEPRSHEEWREGKAA